MAPKPRLSRADTETMEAYGFDFTTPPEKDNSRRSRYDDMWEAAKSLLQRNPGKTLRVRTYPSSSSAYDDAKKINNGEHRMFKDANEVTDWTAVAAPSDNPNDVGERDGKPHTLTALYLTYNGEKVE